MGIRLEIPISILKGLTLDLSKSGASWTVDGTGALVNLRGDYFTK